jgi:hypothetical protein
MTLTAKLFTLATAKQFTLAGVKRTLADLSYLSAEHKYVRYYTALTIPRKRTT